MPYQSFLDSVTFNADGLVPVIVQDHITNDVLMMAWMNRESLEKTLATSHMCYWSRARKAFWRKGETSGQYQQLKSLSVDCDGDTLLAKIEQTGVACHTGRRSCFYRTFKEGELIENQQVVISPSALYQ